MQPCDIHRIYGLTDDDGNVTGFSASIAPPAANSVLVVDLNKCIPIPDDALEPVDDTSSFEYVKAHALARIHACQTPMKFDGFIAEMFAFVTRHQKQSWNIIPVEQPVAVHAGLTARETFAGLAMQSAISEYLPDDVARDFPGMNPAEVVAKIAVFQADALIAALNNTPVDTDTIPDTQPVMVGDLVEVINADNESSLAKGCQLTVTDVSRNRQIIRATTDRNGLKHPHMLLRSDVRRVPHEG